jgi:hypothetical protein
MIHVGMAHESVRYLQNLFGRESVEIPHVKQKGTLFKEERDKKGRVFQWGIHQAGMKGGPHWRMNLTI